MFKAEEKQKRFVLLPSLYGSSQVALGVKNSPATHLCMVVIGIDAIRYFLPRLCHFSLALSFSVFPFSLQLPQSRQELSY